MSSTCNLRIILCNKLCATNLFCFSLSSCNHKFIWVFEVVRVQIFLKLRGNHLDAYALQIQCEFFAAREAGMVKELLFDGATETTMTDTELENSTFL